MSGPKNNSSDPIARLEQVHENEQVFAALMFDHMRALRGAGFTDDEALKLTIAYQASMFQDDRE
jgi:hypothetical protein